MSTATRKPESISARAESALSRSTATAGAVKTPVAAELREPDLVSIVMPALNEEAAIGETIANVPVHEFEKRGFRVEIVVVDNGSTDRTAEIATDVGARVISEDKRGYGNAYRRGFKEARGAFICTMDADSTYPSDVMPELVSRLHDDELDFINTNRLTLMTNGVMSKRNKIGNALLTGLTRVLFRHPFKDSQSGMWVFRAELLDRMNLKAGGMALSQEIKLEAGSRLKARCAEVPITYRYRVGDSKLNVWRDGIINLLHLARRRLS
ncbi:MAG: glycosyltransferase family 2 protein [Chloroflexi bacterium]|nr:glycosyltransferase family 2 protein [Chloroflexota bacterium]